MLIFDLEKTVGTIGRFAGVAGSKSGGEKDRCTKKCLSGSAYPGEARYGFSGALRRFMRLH